MKIAFLYAGQGSQKAGMGKDLYEKSEIFKSVIDSIRIDFDIKEYMFYKDEKTIEDTRYTQPCLAAFAMGVTQVLYDASIKPEYSAGLSLGEYSALYAAGVFNQETLMNTVNFRGKVMKESTGMMEFKMSAVIGLNRDILLKICQDVMSLLANEGLNDEYVTISNYNCPKQYVICGTKMAMERAELLAKEKGARRCVQLKVSGPFHTKFMKPAGDKLKNYFSNITFGNMEVPVVFNTTARILENGQSISNILVQQVQSSIYMEDIITYLDTHGVDTIIEIGPGKVLSGFVKRTTNNIKTYSIEDYESLLNVIDLVKEDVK